MKHLIRKCPKCGLYTMKLQCPKCSMATIDPHPPKYSPDDKYASYRIADRYVQHESINISGNSSKDKSNAS